MILSGTIFLMMGHDGPALNDNENFVFWVKVNL
jgi:hypothetical protein